jgi:tRNA (mo5U34)-methyltransferase
MQDTEIVERIGSFPRWHYQFDLNGFKTPIFEEGWINRHNQRKDHIFPALIGLFGGSLTGKRILDLGCNAGYWSLGAIEHGCRYVLGVEGRQMHIDQANLVFEAKGIEKERYDFRCGNVLEVLAEDIGRFDIVFCFGLMYHTCKSVELIELASRVNDDVLVIDTSLSHRRGSVLEIRHEPVDNPTAAVDYELILWPSRLAVMDIVRQFGYAAVVLEPRFSDYTCADDYQEGTRRVFLCSKRTDLAGVPAEAESRDIVPDLMEVRPRDLVRALVRKLRRRIGLAG